VETVLVEDVLHRFMLERAGVRGVIVRLGPAWREVAGRADYPAALRDLLGQSLAASALLTGNIKLDGALSIELKSAGALRLLFAECSDTGRLRGLARWDGAVPDELPLSSLPDAIMAITIGHAERGKRYQGLVDLRHSELAGALENYFQQSEQLPARIILAANEQHAVGLMLQKLPGEGGRDAVHDEDAWPRIALSPLSRGNRALVPAASARVRLQLFARARRNDAALAGPRRDRSHAGNAAWSDRSDVRILRAYLHVRSCGRGTFVEWRCCNLIDGAVKQ
jgi:molecular chaperone Hsp33